MFENIQKENVDNLLRLRSLRHRQTPILLKRVNVHALRRELSTSALAIFSIWRIGENKNPKVDVHPICPLYVISAHRLQGFLVILYFIIYYAHIMQRVHVHIFGSHPKSAPRGSLQGKSPMIRLHPLDTSWHAPWRELS